MTITGNRRANREAITIARMTNGLGNQLFIYAAARRIAIERGGRLFLDAVSAFQTDKYRAIYQLGHFNVAAELAPPRWCYATALGRRRREILATISKHLPLAHKLVVKEKDFKSRAGHGEIDFSVKLRRRLRVEGYWISERYFAPIAETVRRDLTIRSPLSPRSRAVLEEIRGAEAICIHVRNRIGAPHLPNVPPPPHFVQLPFSYYEKAIAFMTARVKNPVFFCFSDSPEWLRERWRFPYPAHFVTHNERQENAYEDFALMKECRHFIIAYSSFSWWPAWLGSHPDKQVVAPRNAGHFAWKEPDAIPAAWHSLDP